MPLVCIYHIYTLVLKVIMVDSARILIKAYYFLNLWLWEQSVFSCIYLFIIINIQKLFIYSRGNHINFNIRKMSHEAFWLYFVVTFSEIQTHQLSGISGSNISRVWVLSFTQKNQTESWEKIHFDQGLSSIVLDITESDKLLFMLFSPDTFISRSLTQIT